MKPRHAFIILAIIAILGGTVVPQPARPLLPAGPAPDLGLAFTSQVIGWIEPCG